MGALLDELRETEPTRIDYVGFTFNGIHSSQLNILSVSDGSRYHMDLLPTPEDYSIDIVGGYGANYFGGMYKKREITLNIAYDKVEEKHFRAMKEWLSDRETHELFFDECPYKVYNAVVSKTPTFKYIAFGNVGTRVYKGEGTIVFTCYDPIAYSKNGNYLSDYEWENIEEWAEASNMKENKKLEGVLNGSDYYDTVINNQINAYNAGELPTPFKLYITWNSRVLEIKNKTINKSLKLVRTATTPYDLLIDTERSLAIGITYEDNTPIEYSFSDAEGQFYDKNGLPASEAEKVSQMVVLNQLVEEGRFFFLQPGLNQLEIIGGTVRDGVIINGKSTNGFQFYHRYL